MMKINFTFLLLYLYEEKTLGNQRDIIESYELEGDSWRRFVVNFCNKCSLSAEMIEQAKKFDMIL